MLPLVRREADEVNTEVFAELTYHAAYEPQRAIRTKRFKYIRRFDERETPVLPNVDDSPSKDVLIEHGWAERPIAREQLYDLVFDPGEGANLAADPAYEHVRRELSERLDRWMLETGDPLLDGSVEAPLGAELNEPGQRSAAEPRLAAVEP
jgi:arylsulfatase A-like enzyme